ncbi:MAG: HD family phosphohydrolase [Patescibacteria group bacterium]
MTLSEKLVKLEQILKPLYVENKNKLPFHGWHHIVFVRSKAINIAGSLNINSLIIESAILVHDLNYIVKTNSEPEEGKTLRNRYLIESGYDEQEIVWIEKIINESHTKTRGLSISDEGRVLSDADTLFKALPITPIIFAGKYITENEIDISKLAQKIVNEQVPLLNEDIYFYTDFAKQNYLKWAETNIELWQNVLDCLKDEDVRELLNNHN